MAKKTATKTATKTKTQPINGAVVPFGEPIAEPEPPADEALGAGEVIGAGRDYMISIDGKKYHHTRETADGRWVYTEVRRG